MCISEKRKLTIPPDMAYGEFSLATGLIPRCPRTPACDSARLDTGLRGGAFRNQESIRGRTLEPASIAMWNAFMGYDHWTGYDRDWTSV